MPPQPPQAGKAELKRHEACGSHARFAFVSDSGWSLEAFCNAPGTNDMPLKPKGEKVSDRGEKRHLRGTNPTVSKKGKDMLSLQLVIELLAISQT